MITTTTAIIVAINTVSQGTQTDPILVTTTRINSKQIEQQHSSIAESDADAENKSDAEIQRIMFRYIPKYVASSG